MTVGSSSVVRLLSEISWWKEPRTKEENLTFATVEFCNPLCWICWNVQAFKITSSPTYRNLRAVCVCAFFMHICHCGGFCAVVIRWMLFFFVCVLHRTPVCLSLSLSFPLSSPSPSFSFFEKKNKRSGTFQQLLQWPLAAVGVKLAELPSAYSSSLSVCSTFVYRLQQLIKSSISRSHILSFVCFFKKRHGLHMTARTPQRKPMGQQ